MDNLLTDGQPNPGTGVPGSGVQTLKKAEYLLAVSRTDADSVVMHTYPPHCTFVMSPHFNYSWFHTSVFDSVSDDVLEQLEEVNVFDGEGGW